MGYENNTKAITETGSQIHANFHGNSGIVPSQYINQAGAAPEMN